MNEKTPKRRRKVVLSAEVPAPVPEDPVATLQVTVALLLNRVDELEKRNFHSDWNRRTAVAIKKEKA